MEPEELFAVVFVLGMFSGVFTIFLAMRQRSEQLQMRHRERMAQIERGQIPLSEPAHARRVWQRTPSATSRSLSAGILVVGLGVALMTVVSIAGGSPEAGVGVGGAVAIIGAAFIIRSLVVRSEAAAQATEPTAPAAHLQDSSSPSLPSIPPPDDRV